MELVKGGRVKCPYSISSTPVALPTHFFVMNSFKHSVSGDYVAAFDTAATLIISAKIKNGDKYIILHDLYVTLGAETKAEQTSVRMAVRKAKASGVLTKTQTLGVYAVK